MTTYTATAVTGQPAIVATSSVAEDAVIITCTTSSNGLSSINSSTGYAIKGAAIAVTGNTTAIYADATATSGYGTGVYAISTNGNGVYAQSSNQDAIHAKSTSNAHAGIWAENPYGYAIAASNGSNVATITAANSGNGPVLSATAASISNPCITIANNIGAGLSSNVNGNGANHGINTYNSGTGYGILAQAPSSVAVYGSGAWGLYGESGINAAVYAHGYNTALAGEFIGTVSKSGGTFKIDHPQDPENKYLLHSFVESPDMKNVYDGVGATDANGELVVEMPSYFESLNSDFRYQLTPLGQSAPNMFVKEELTNGKFVVAGANAGQRISWQITGIRKDPWALKNPITVEMDKSVDEKGLYRHPEVYGKPEEMSIHHKMTKKSA